MIPYFGLIHVVFILSNKTMSNSLSSFFQLLSLFPCSSTSTSPSVIAVCLPLLENNFNEQHWNLVNIVSMVAKLGNMFRKQHLCPGSKNDFDFELSGQNIFCFRAAKLFPQYAFPTRLNWETYVSLFIPGRQCRGRPH